MQFSNFALATPLLYECRKTNHLQLFLLYYENQYISYSILPTAPITRFLRNILPVIIIGFKPENS